MEAEYINMLLLVVEEALTYISNDPILKNKILSESINIDDWIQLKLGKVSKRSQKEAIELAIKTSVVKDKDTICRIIALITTLYATNTIERGAELGGTLLKEFGRDIFPHINNNELRFAKNINREIYQAVLMRVNNSFESYVRAFNFKADDFINKTSYTNAWNATSIVGVYGISYLLITYGAKFIRNIRMFIGLSN